MAKMMKSAERALHKRTNKMLASTTKRYKKFMRQAAKTASEHKREQYLAAALSALVVTGVVASKLMANLEGKKAAGPARRKRKTKAK
jgi:F0F1-type ATP synthase assembly protein I